MKRIEFAADKASVAGPKVDGGYKVTFEVGEYMQQAVSELLRLPQQRPLKVSVEVEDDSAN